jgi:hypothetical protein
MDLILTPASIGVHLARRLPGKVPRSSLPLACGGTVEGNQNPRNRLLHLFDAAGVALGRLDIIEIVEPHRPEDRTIRLRQCPEGPAHPPQL